MRDQREAGEGDCVLSDGVLLSRVALCVAAVAVAVAVVCCRGVVVSCVVVCCCVLLCVVVGWYVLVCVCCVCVLLCVVYVVGMCCCVGLCCWVLCVLLCVVYVVGMCCCVVVVVVIVVVVVVEWLIFLKVRGYQRGLASLCCVTVQCSRATHGLPTVWALVYRGCPCREPPVCLPMPRQDGIGDKAPTLCCACACAASSWRAHSTIWNCGVVNTGADGYGMSAPPVEWAECSAQSSRTNSSALISSLHVPPCDRRCRNPSC